MTQKDQQMGWARHDKKAMGNTNALVHATQPFDNSNSNDLFGALYLHASH